MPLPNQGAVLATPFTARGRVRRLWTALRRLVCSVGCAELRWMDSATLADMKLPFEMTNTVRREQALRRPFAVRDVED